MKNYTEELKSEYPYLQDLELFQVLNKYSNQTIILSANLPVKLIDILITLSKGNNSVTFQIVKNRVTFYCDSINNMRPLFGTLKNYY